MTAIFFPNRKPGRERHFTEKRVYEGRIPCEDKGRVMHLQCKECQNLSANHQILRERSEIFYSIQEPSEGTHHTHTLFTLQNWETINFSCLSKASQFVVLCYNPKK